MRTKSRFVIRVPSRTGSLRRFGAWVACSLLVALNAQGATEDARLSQALSACSIVDAREASGAVEFRFSGNMFWYFQDSQGGSGIIGLQGVLRYVERDDGKYDEMPLEPGIRIRIGEQLSLWENHAGCLIKVEAKADRVWLRIRSSFSFMGPSRVEEYEVPLP